MWFLLLISIVLLINQSNGNLFLMKYYNEHLCLTKTSDGLVFITPPKLKSLTITSESLPSFKNDIHNCDINFQSEECDPIWMIEPWKVIRSLNGDINDYVLDRRWQNFEETLAEYPYDHKFYFYPITIETSNFEIPFSIRTDKEAHIYLCDGDDPLNSNCYWFLIGAWSGNTTALRKCKQYEIPNRSETPKKNCAKKLVEFSHLQDSFDYLTDRQWRHFKLIKRENLFQLSTMNKVLLKYNDPERLIDIKYMILHSRSLQNALWRIHDYQYLWTNEEQGEVLGPVIYIYDSTFCASMFIAMCDVCELHLSLFDTRSKQTYFKEIYRSKTKGWQEITYKKYGIKFYGVQLNVQTVARDRISEHFWAIDSFKICQDNEYNAIRLTTSEKVACQRLAETNDEIVTITNQTDDLTFISEDNCSIDVNYPTIGDECLPCDYVSFSSCSGTKYCRNDNVGRSICTCSAGYYTNSCNTYCPYGTYGPNCQKTCGHCIGNCNRRSGACSPCELGFTGKRCDIPDAGAILKNPPALLNVSYNTCLVKQENFTLISSRYKNNDPQYFEIQFQNSSVKSSEWHAVQRYNWNDARSVLIDDLRADTTYLIRSVLIDRFNQYTYDGEIVPVTACKTLCREVTQDNVEITPTNVSATLAIAVDKTSCRMQNCQIFIGQRRFGIRRDNTFFIEYLQPFTDYKASLENCGNISPLNTVFKTLEGRPSVVQDLTVLSKTSTTLEIQWNKPNNANGIIRHYEIIYEYISSKACKSITTTATQIMSTKVDSTFIKLDNLQPYSMYNIKIAAATSLTGDFESLQTDTEEAETLSAEEIPNILRIKPTSDSVEIKLNAPNCNLIRGKLSIMINGSCTNPWCSNSLPINYSIDYQLNFNIDKLLPYSTYNFDLNFCRNQCRRIEPTTTVTTTEQRPNHNFELSIYSIDDTSVSIRFKEPHPPTGIFQHFLIATYSKRYSYSQYTKINTDIVERSTNQCKFWQEYYCTTFDNINLFTYYRFEISAKNQQPNDYSQTESIDKYIKIEKPNPPYDLALNWTIDNRLIISWKHPNFTSGYSTTFILQITSSQTQRITKEISYSKDQYNLTYSYTVQSKVATAVQYNIVVKSKNSQSQESEEVTKIDTSPPPVPSLKSNLVVDFINSTIILKLPYQTDNSINLSVKILISNGNHSIIPPQILDRMPEMDLEIHRIITEQIITNSIGEFVIKEDSKGEALVDSQQYTITVILINQYAGKLRSKIYTKVVPSELVIDESGDSISIILPILLCLIVLLLLAFVVMKRKWIQSNVDTWKQRFISEDKHSHDDQLQLTQVPDTKPVIAPKPQIQIEKKPVKPNGETKQGKYSKRIKITDFEDYVKQSIENGELERQHALFPRGKVMNCSYGELKVNKSKNRYNNLIAYDHSRVILDKINGDQYSDYINANYVDGYKEMKAYIATQGPKPNTLYDFWRMIWQNNSEFIVMLANVHENGKKKVEKYWPDINEHLQFEDIHIQYLSNKVFADYEIREFQISKDNQQRKIKQLHFMTWPDHGVPLYSRNLVPFLQEMLKIPNSQKSPVVVHCSAGVGRTGTIILCDIALRMAAREGAIDVLNILEIMRNQRSNLVDNYEQYKLAHLVILECLVGMHTSIPCNDIELVVQQLFKVDKIKIQMDYLERTAWQDQAMNTVSQVEEALIVDQKNRVKDIVPEIQGRVFLARYPTTDETSSYINAVRVDAFRNPGRFIVTQQPLPNTVGDFWRLIVENNITVIVNLNTIDLNDKSCCEFWPTLECPDLQPVDFLQLKYVNIRSTNCYDVTTIQMNNERTDTPVTVEIISMKNWPATEKLPRSIDDFLTFWEESDTLCRRSEKVAITCYDGTLACGVYVAVCFIIEKMKLEQNCDVCHAVRTIRQNRRQFVQDEAQFRFLYEAAVKYINVFQSYANFK